MLLDIIKSIFKKAKKGVAADVEGLFAEAEKLSREGRKKEAISIYRRVVELDTTHIWAMNNLGACCIDINESEEAGHWFEMALRVNDEFAPALVNYARHLNVCFRGAEAEKYLLKAKGVMPGAPHIDIVLGAIKMSQGSCDEACGYYLDAWMKEFDSQRFAHNYLFASGYSGVMSAEMNRQEHEFWARTLSPNFIFEEDSDFQIFLQGSGGEKLRIGYLSPDFRQHSVRYFIVPLLAGHDKSRVELYAYHDMAGGDAQTDRIKSYFDVWHDVANMPDSELVKKIRADRLDVLVELAGHTSTSRIYLFGNRMARIQMTALGYPLTTGMGGVDYKVVDQYAAPPGTEALYTERLLRLSGSFWCFNPMEDTPPVAPSPALSCDYITFGCFGNISKITDEMLKAWSSILSRVVRSRLIVKSLTFQDAAAVDAFGLRLSCVGIDEARVRLVLPDPPDKLYLAYNEIDIVLDTYPFNGGTTTCFSVWMGVPYVTLAGEALISRMGASMLSVLGLDDLIAGSYEEYVDVAVGLAEDLQALNALRLTIRERMLATTLGNPDLYARSFESACFDLLGGGRRGSDLVRVPLAEDVLVARTDKLLMSGQLAAARRVVKYLLDNNPNSAAGLIRWSELVEFDEGLLAARDVLLDAYIKASGDAKIALGLNVIRSDLLLSDYMGALGRVDELMLVCDDGLARKYLKLYSRAAEIWLGAEEESACSEMNLPFVSVLINCNDDARYAELEAHLARHFKSGSYEVLRSCCASRGEGYAGVELSGCSKIVMMLREDIRLCGRSLHALLAAALDAADVVGIIGRADIVAGGDLDGACGAVIRPSRSRVQGYDLLLMGGDEFCQGVSVLDGAVLACRVEVFKQVGFEPQLFAGGGLCEMDWSWRAGQAGYRLMVEPRLAALLLGVEARTGRDWAQAAALFEQRYGLPVGAVEELMAGIGDAVALPLPELALVDRFLEGWKGGL